MDRYSENLTILFRMLFIYILFWFIYLFINCFL